MGYLSDLIASLSTQIDTVTTDGERGALIRQLAEAQQASATDVTDGIDAIPSVTSYDLAEAQTAATGTNWTALASGTTKNVTVRNRTATSIDIRKVGGSTFFSLADGDDVTFPVLANSNEWEIKRTDNSNTQVVVKFLRYA
jgi:hypothetical protein